MNKIKKILVPFVSALMIASAVLPMASCGDGKGGGSKVNTGDMKVVAYDGSEVTVTFYHTMGEKLREVLDAYIPEFNKIYPNITIDHGSKGDYPGLRDQISTELTAGNSPSLAYCYPDHVALYNKAKAVLVLDDYIKSDLTVAATNEKVGFTQEQLDDFVSAYYKEGSVYGDGKMYTLPYSKSTEVLYYNKTFFEENDLSVPTTWDEMEALCKQIKEMPGHKKSIIPLGYDSEANWFITMTEQYGTPYTSAKKGEYFLFNTAENRAFVEKFRDWYNKGYVITEETYGGSYTSNLFTDKDAKQRSYMCIGSSGGASYQNPAKNSEGKYPFEVGVAMIPQVNKEDPKIISQGPAICLFKKQNEQEVAAAWLFAKFLTTNVALQAEFSEASGYAPVIKSVNQDEEYAKFLEKADGNAYLQASVIKQCLAQQENCYVSPAFVGSSAARDQVGLLMQNCFVKKLEGKTVAQFIQDEFDAVLEELQFDYGN